MMDTLSRSTAHADVDDDLTDRRNFRAILRAMSRPGLVSALGGTSNVTGPLDAAIEAIARCFFDNCTNVWLDSALDTDDVRAHLKLHLGVPIVTEAHQALFAVVGTAEKMPSLDAYSSGVDEYPDQSTTLVVKVTSLSDGPTVLVGGPGIESHVSFSIGGLPSWFWDAWDSNVRRFPLGVDVLFTDGYNVVGLPRTAKRV